jgi:hypothetical protein
VQEEEEVAMYVESLSGSIVVVLICALIELLSFLSVISCMHAKHARRTVASFCFHRALPSTTMMFSSLEVFKSTI